jgi:hypothetical protein
MAGPLSPEQQRELMPKRSRGKWLNAFFLDRHGGFRRLATAMRPKTAPRGMPVHQNSVHTPLCQ